MHDPIRGHRRDRLDGLCGQRRRAGPVKGGESARHGPPVPLLPPLLVSPPHMPTLSVRSTTGRAAVMRHVISALVMNEPGVLAGVANMFSARGFNIDSLVVGRTEDPGLSRMTIVVIGDDQTLDQVRKQLAKLVPVVSVVDYRGTAYIERDLALVTVGVTTEHRGEVIEIANLFRGKVVDVAPESLMIELAGTEQK